MEDPDEIEYEHCQIKQQDGTWIEAVAYRPMETWTSNKTGKTMTTRNWDKLYVRGKEDFLSKFTKVEEE